MKFMNKKEQVLDIQLTPYGEYLLSQGQFKPQYYSFYDDNILYESQYAGYADSQNNIEPRTQEDTPQFETQVVFSSRDLYHNVVLATETPRAQIGSLEVLVAIAEGGSEITQDVAILEQMGKERMDLSSINTSFFDRYHYGPQYCLGRSDILKTDAPAWSISLLKGEITGSAKAITGSNTPTINIPQIDCTLTYKIDVLSDKQFISDTELAIQYPNGEYLNVRPEILLAQVIEKNAEFTKENFDIEVFEVTNRSFKKNELGGNIESLRQLKLRKPYNLVQDSILLDEDEVFVSEEPLTKEYVEYYFHVKVDNQIDKQLICSSVSELESRGFYVDTEIECEDVKNISLVDIYTTDAVSDICPDPTDDPCEPGTLY